MNSEVAPTKKARLLLIAIQILVGLEYAAVLGMSFANPINAYGIGTPYREYSFAIFSMAVLGMSGLSYALRNIKQREEVWLWLLITVGLAPFVAFVVSMLINILFRALGFSGSGAKSYEIVNILCFYLPFVLVAYKLKNKYREDRL